MTIRGEEQAFEEDQDLRAGFKLVAAPTSPTARREFRAFLELKNYK